MTPSKTELESWLLAPRREALDHAHATGDLIRVIPEWSRLVVEENLQHQAHHYPLDEHTLHVVAGTKASPHFARMSSYYRILTALAALLHDIDKLTGPRRLHRTIPVDKRHPIKSAERSRGILTRLGYSPDVIQRVYTLIHHHQAFGRLFIFYPDGAPDHVLEQIAVKIRCPDLLTGLLALSEGDIAGVRRERGFFTEAVSNQLEDYGARVARIIHGFPVRQHPTIDWSDRVYYSQSSEATDWGGVFLAVENPLAGYTEPIRCLPENIAYRGPLPADSPFRLPMTVFYTLLLGHPLLHEPVPEAAHLLLDALRQAASRPAGILLTRPIRA